MGFLKNLFAKKEYRTIETVEVDEHLRQIMGLVTDTKTALEIPAVSACIDFISGKIAELPIKLYKESDGKTTEITDDIRLSLLNDSTGDLLDCYQMKSAFVRDYLLHGAGYIFPERNGNEFVSLRYIANENVSVTKNYDPIYKTARYQIGTRQFFDDEIMRICRNTVDGVTGVGIIREHNDILTAAYKQIVYERYLVERGGNKKGFIQVDDRVTQEVLDDLKEKWRTLYSSDNSNMMILNKGLKFVESSNTSVEMQLNESKDTNNELICQMFGLSSKVISGTASDEEYISAIKTAVMPIVSAIQTALNKFMLLWAEKSDHYYILDTKELLKGDILKRYQAYQIALHEGFLQVDEVRYEEDREPFNLNWIKLGLQDVLFDTKNHTIYTPNTNQTVKFGEFSIDKQNKNGIMEKRGWITKNGRHIYIGDDGNSSGGGYSFSSKVRPEVQQAFNEEYKAMTEKFGKISTITEVEPMTWADKSEYGNFNDSSGVLSIRFAEQKDCQKKLAQAAVENKQNGKWSSSHPNHVFRHEIGHAIQLEHKLNDKNWNSKLGRIENIMSGIDKKTVSIYAFRDTSEFISECIAESMTKKARKTAKDVVSIILESD